MSNTLLKPYCCLREHQWVDDPFMGDGQECERCGAFDHDYKGTQTHIVEGAILVGFGIGFIVGMVATVTVIA